MPIDKNTQKQFLFGAVLLICTLLLNFYTTAYGSNSNFYPGLLLMRPLIYIGLYTAWALSFKKRILHQKVQQYMIAICCFAIFFMLIRCIKYYFVIDWTIKRQLWYLYYLPLIFVPLLVLCISVSLGQNEHYAIPKWTRTCFFPAVLLLLMVISNDLHQLVFSFQDITDPLSEYNYTHEAGYYAIFAWIFLCFLAAYIIMIDKSRKKKNFFLLPLLPYTLMILCIILDLASLWPSFIYYDICIVMTLLPIIALECCIQTGLIASNSGYGALFMADNFGAQIYDKQGNLYLRSVNARLLDMKNLILDENDAFLYDKNTIIKKNAISGGSVLWQEDISEIATLLERLDDNRKLLEKNVLIEEENCRIKRQISALKERNRIFDVLIAENTATINNLKILINTVKTENDTQMLRNNLIKILLSGTYLKRRGNLILIKEKTSSIPMEELILSLEEICGILRIADIECGISLSGYLQFPSDDLIRLLDFVWQHLEIRLTKLSAVHVTENRDGNSYELRLALMLSMDSSVENINTEPVLQLKKTIPNPKEEP